MYSKSPSSDGKNDILIADIVVFIKDARKIILIMGLIGLLVGSIYFVLAQRKYEATALIGLAQIPSSMGGRNDVQWINVEEPQTIIFRMNHSAAFNQEVSAACSDDEWGGSHGWGSVTSSFFIKLSPWKGGAGALELRVRGTSQNRAKACADAVFKAIKSDQGKLTEPYLNSVNVRLEADTMRRDRVKAFLQNADEHNSFIGGVYLSARDEISQLTAEINGLQNLALGLHQHQARFISPIFSSVDPVSPSVEIVFLGLFGGLLLGLVVAIFVLKLSGMRMISKCLRSLK